MASMQRFNPIDSAKAQYKDGVLNLTLPKKPDSQTRFVSVT
jgi:HSP20 family molecular chaperone IbpA